MNFIEKILREKVKEIASLRKKTFLPKHNEHSFINSLKTGSPPRIIAEIKRISPARGPLKIDLDIHRQVRFYEKGGARAISVLTDKNFGGSTRDLTAVVSQTRLPVLRKDFIINPLQIEESAHYGAKAVLLIVKLVSPKNLKALLCKSQSLGLDAIVEVHTEEELKVAIEAGAQIIGINSRDLRTLRLNLNVIKALAPKIPKDITVVAESGIRSTEDVKRLMDVGIENFLIGETLMLSKDPCKKIMEFCNAC